MKIVIVGFSTKTENSVYYKKKDFIELRNMGKTDEQIHQIIGNYILMAKDVGAEFISIRFID